MLGLGFALSAFALTAQSLPKLEMVAAPRDLTFWAISAVDENVAWVAANHGTIGRTLDGGKHWSFNQVKGSEALEFRSVYAFDANIAIIANVGSPAFVLRTTDGGMNWSTVYKNDAPDASLMASTSGTGKKEWCMVIHSMAECSRSPQSMQERTGVLNCHCHPFSSMGKRHSLQAAPASGV